MFRSLMIANFSLTAITRISLMSVCVAFALFSTGCCGPMGRGPGCGTGGCYDCDGTATMPIPQGPLDGLRNFKRSLVCGGGGCGETYVGEWISTPPDRADPCCGNQFVGGATKCRPFCWTPGSLIGSLNLYGQRFCSGNESSCDCGDVGCDGSCGIGGDYFAGEVYGNGVAGGSDCGCASNASGSDYRQVVNSVPRTTIPTRSAAVGNQARTAARVDRIRR